MQGLISISGPPHTHTHLCITLHKSLKLLPAGSEAGPGGLRANKAHFTRTVAHISPLSLHCGAARDPPAPLKKKKKTCSSLTQTLCRPETTAPPPSLLYTSYTDDDDEGGGAPVLPCASSARNNPNNETPRGAVRGAGAEPGEDRRAGPRDSPVGVRGLVDDVLVGGEQGQPVIAEIHSHVSVPASIQPLLMERDSE